METLISAGEIIIREVKLCSALFVSSEILNGCTAPLNAQYGISAAAHQRSLLTSCNCMTAFPINYFGVAAQHRVIRDATV